MVPITEKYLLTDSSILHYVKAGTGDKKMLVFHGFGQDNKVFSSLIAELSEQYTLFVFDLFFHGKSKWSHGEKPLEKDQWKKMINLFLNENEIERFSLAGFSLGGKFVLATLETFADKVEKIVLIAPDGIKTSFWYSLATYPGMLRKFFRTMIFHPERFFTMATLANKLKLADKGLIRFAEHQMSTEEKRKRVYYSWIVFRHLTFSMQTIAEKINTHHIPLLMIIGKYDKVITGKNMNRLLVRIKNFQMEVLETGHNGLIRESIKLIRTF